MAELKEVIKRTWRSTPGGPRAMSAIGVAKQVFDH